MQYELFDRAQQRAMCRDQLAALEQQHYLQVLTKLAQSSNANAVATINETIAKLEEGIDALRKELSTFDDVKGATPAAAPPVDVVTTPPPPPAPAQRASAVAGGAVSEPGDDTPKP